MLLRSYPEELAAIYRKEERADIAEDSSSRLDELSAKIERIRQWKRKTYVPIRSLLKNLFPPMLLIST